MRRVTPARPVSSWRNELEAVACGPMFGFDGGHVRPLTALRDRAAGVELESTQPDVGGMVAVVNGAARWVDGGTVPDGATVAVLGYPAVVVNGSVAVTGAHDQEQVSRVAVGIDRDGRVFLAFARALSMLAFARWIAANGGRFATYLDGGSAAALDTRNQSVSVNASRALPSVVGFAATSSSSSTRERFDPAPVILGLAAAFAWRRARR